MDADPHTQGLEAILDPGRPIVDPHHHLWESRVQTVSHRGGERYLMPQLLADAMSGHAIRATVYVEAGSMIRPNGPEPLRPVGETEFVNGVAAMSASGIYGDSRLCAGIVGHADLTLGSAVEVTLAAHIRAGGGRFRGIRQSASWDADPAMIGALRKVKQGLYLDSGFRAGFARLAPLGLSFDAILFHPQLPDLTDLARAFPETRIILNHVGVPLGIGRFAGRRAEVFAEWRRSLAEVARCPNVSAKVGGFGMRVFGSAFYMRDPPASSAELAAEWRPYVEAAIEIFGADRCMFESNYPVDRAAADYPAIWNAFKRLTLGYSEAEKTALFSGTAIRVYRLPDIQ